MCFFKSEISTLNLKTEHFQFLLQANLWEHLKWKSHWIFALCPTFHQISRLGAAYFSIQLFLSHRKLDKTFCTAFHKTLHQIFAGVNCPLISWKVDDLDILRSTSLFLFLIRLLKLIEILTRPSTLGQSLRISPVPPYGDVRRWMDGWRALGPSRAAGVWITMRLSGEKRFWKGLFWIWNNWENKSWKTFIFAI